MSPYKSLEVLRVGSMKVWRRCELVGSTCRHNRRVGWPAVLCQLRFARFPLLPPNPYQLTFFDLQDDVAGGVLSELSNCFDVKRYAPHLDLGTDNIEACDAYLQGRHGNVEFTGKACDLAVDQLGRRF